MIRFTLRCQDSALFRIQKLPDDNAKVSRLLVYGKTFSKTDGAKATAIFNEAISIGQRLHDEYGIARLINLGYVHLSTGNYQLSIQQYKTAIGLLGMLNKIREMCGDSLCQTR